MYYFQGEDPEEILDEDDLDIALDDCDDDEEVDDEDEEVVEEE